MTEGLKTLLLFVLRVAILWLVDAVALGLAAFIVPGANFTSVDGTPAWVVVVGAAFLLGLVNLLVRPIALLIARPLGFFAVFLLAFLLNSLSIWLTAALLPGFSVSGFFSAVLAGFVFAVVNVVVTGVLELDEDGSFYQGRIIRQAKKRPATEDRSGVGLVMLEVDGLSYHHLCRALDEGRLPTLQRMVEEEGYVLSKVDCGLPSQTSACQAGIMFGDNDDIPAFRWFDKTEQKLYVSSKDAPALNARYAHGQGLMRHGSSIGNMLNGDAETSLLTLADIKTDDREERRRRAADVSLLALDPYFLVRTVVLTLVSAVRELWEGWRQRRRGEWPRLNRLAHFYPLVRGATCVFLRDMTANLAVLDIARGSPSIYLLWPGYDEVAHHSGPWSQDAFGELARWDASVARIRRAIAAHAPRPYEFVILSDHGQSFGATFLQRYGLSLKELIEQHLPQGTTVAQSIGGDNALTSLQALDSELENVHEQGGSLSRAVAGGGERLVARGVRVREEEVAAEPAGVTAYGSGNLAQVYFDLQPRRLTVDELEAAYPGMVDAVVQHEGIGFVGGYDSGGAPVLLSKGGRRHLVTGEVTGDDPLLPYLREDHPDELEKRVWQVKRVMDFPHAGDLMVNSTVFEDGTVAALEELIGNHGGLGGEQTDAFLFHPPQVEVGPTRTACDVFSILDRRRGAEPVPPQAAPAGDLPGEEWSPDNLMGGLRRIRYWVSMAGRCLTLNREAYRQVAADPSLTGPAVVIALAGLALTAAARPGSDWASFPTLLAVWLAATVAVFGAGRLLTGRGTYTRTFRTLGFAQSVAILEVLAFLPQLSGPVNLVVLLIGFVAIWLAASAAHESRGWTTLLLPVVASLLIVAGYAALHLLVVGASFGLDSLLQDLGMKRG